MFESVVKQAGGKIMYSKAAPETNYQHVMEALDLLIMAGWVIPVTHTAAKGLPLGAEMDRKKRKMLLLDTGVFQPILGLDLANFMFGRNDDSPINKGALAEQFWGLEYLKYSSPWSPPALYYWHREYRAMRTQKWTMWCSRGTESSRGSKILEAWQHVKPWQFLMEKNRAYGYRFALENFSANQDVKCIPLIRG